MRAVIRKEPLSALSDYGSVSIAFSASTVLEVEWVANGLGGVRMVEAPLSQPFTKDFDAYEPVTRWHRLGDISHWGVFAAFIDDTRVGGAVVAHDTPGVHMLEARKDLAVLSQRARAWAPSKRRADSKIWSGAGSASSCSRRSGARSCSSARYMKSKKQSEGQAPRDPPNRQRCLPAVSCLTIARDLALAYRACRIAAAVVEPVE